MKQHTFLIRVLDWVILALAAALLALGALTLLPAQPDPAGPELPAAVPEPDPALVPLIREFEARPDDPDTALTLGTALRRAGENESARQVLHQSWKRTGDERLLLPLRAVDATLSLGEYQRGLLDRLFAMIGQSSPESDLEALRLWGQHRQQQFRLPTEGGWVDTDGLCWDGSAFWADLTGTGLTWTQSGRMFAGPLADGMPSGAGLGLCSVPANIPEEGDTWMWMSGDWDNGIPVDHVELHQRTSWWADPSFDLTAEMDGRTGYPAAGEIDYRERCNHHEQEHSFRLRLEDHKLAREINGLPGQTAHSLDQPDCPGHLTLFQLTDPDIPMPFIWKEGFEPFFQIPVTFDEWGG